MANKPTDTIAIQAELVSGTTHTLVWIPQSLKATEGSTLFAGDDPTQWTVLHLYSINKRSFDSIKTDWKVGGLK